MNNIIIENMRRKSLNFVGVTEWAKCRIITMLFLCNSCRINILCFIILKPIFGNFEILSHFDSAKLQMSFILLAKISLTDFEIEKRIVRFHLRSLECLARNSNRIVTLICRKMMITIVEYVILWVHF